MKTPEDRREGFFQQNWNYRIVEAACPCRMSPTATADYPSERKRTRAPTQQLVRPGKSHPKRNHEKDPAL